MSSVKRIYHRVDHFLLILFFLLVSPVVNAQGANQTVEPSAADETLWYEKDAAARPVIHLYFFWSKKCPHCLKAMPDVVDIDREFPWLKLHSLEFLEHPENVQRFNNMAAMFSDGAHSVPTFMFCGNMLGGYGDRETTGRLLKSHLLACKKKKVTGLKFNQS